MLRYRVSETLSAAEFLRIGKGCANLIRSHLAVMGMKLEDAQRVLDFGCGCGRTVRWFLDRAGKTEFHGVDVDAEATSWCTAHHPAGRFTANDPYPPLPYAGDYFDVIYCVSVFTHLNEAMQNVWLKELNRILKPGGILLLTVYAKAVTLGLNEEGRQQLQSSGFVHARSKKLKGLVPDWYQTSWHSPEYIRARLSGDFADIQYCEVPGGLQDVVLARKTTNPAG